VVSTPCRTHFENCPVVTAAATLRRSIDVAVTGEDQAIGPGAFITRAIARKLDQSSHAGVAAFRGRAKNVSSTRQLLRAAASRVAMVSFRAENYLQRGSYHYPRSSLKLRVIDFSRDGYHRALSRSKFRSGPDTCCGTMIQNGEFGAQPSRLKQW
jgi:hypothetical protein